MEVERMNQIAIVLDRLIEATAWEMIPPTAYGPFHLIFTFAGLALCILAAWKLRNLGEKWNRRLLVLVGTVLLVSEIYKQLFYYFHIGNGTYQWWIFPFQLCSVPMYLCLIAPFLRDGKIRKGMYSFMMIYNLLGGFIAFVEPSGLIHSYWTLTLHAFCWHMLLVFVGLYLAASGRGGKEIRDYWSATAAFVALCALAFCLNLIFWKSSNGSMNMFFVGPANSPLIVFKDIAKNFGWYVSTALYIPVVSLGGFLIFLPFYLYAKCAKKRNLNMVNS